MSEFERDREEPEAFVYNGWRREPLPAEPAAATPARCPDCGGRGSILLLITTRPCTRCGGSGRIEPVAPKDVHSYTYTPDAPAPADAELPARIMYSWYTYENDVLVAEERLDCAADGQWWRERYAFVDGEWQLVSRAPVPSADKSGEGSVPRP